MAYEFHLPDIGEGLTEATIVSWKAAVGERIGLDQPMVEIETDKAVVEIPAPRAGVILHHGAPAGTTIAVDSLLVVIGEEGESWSSTPKVAEPKRGEARPIVGNLEEAESGPERTGGLQALPLVRKLAASKGIDLSTVRGSGPGGRILREDIDDAAGGGGPVERVRLSATRVAIARNLTRSWQEIPHVTTFGTADPGAILSARSRLTGEGAAIPLEALLIAAVIPVLKEFPEFNATLDGDHVLLRRHYDIGVAVDAPDGLMVTVVRAADGRDIVGLAAEIVRLATAARERTIPAGDLRGATFTISNIGAVGGGFGTPIIAYGTTAILSVGRAVEKPVVRAGAIGIGREMPLSLSYDHRVIDGAKGRRFLGAVIAGIEGILD